MQTACSDEKDISNSQDYRPYLGSHYRTLINFAVIGNGYGESKYCKYTLLPAVTVYDHDFNPARLRATYGGDKVYGVLPKNSVCEIARFIHLQDMNGVMIYPTIKILSKGSFQGWECYAYILNGHTDEGLIDPSMATIIRPEPSKTQT